MPLFGSKHSKSGRFVFRLKVHELSPFPQKFGSLSIGWTRGSKKGSLHAARGILISPEEALSKFVWNEAIQLDCTLTQERASPGGSTFDKKWLILSVQDAQNPKAKEHLGRVVINLSDYVGQEEPSVISFTVALSKSLSPEVPESKLIISIESQEFGKPLRNGKASILDSSIASSEMSDDVTVDSRSPSVTNSQRQGSVGTSVQESARRPTQYDEDGFIVEDDVRQSPGLLPQVSPARGRYNQKQIDRQASDEDSEDEFLAQAVAAMEGKGQMPSLEQGSRQNTAEQPRATQESPGPSQARAQPPFETRPSPNNPSEAPFKPRGKPLFALKPEGSSEAPESGQQGHEGQTSGLTSRGSRPKLASDVVLNISSKNKTQSSSNSLEQLERPVLKTRQLKPAPPSQLITSQDQGSPVSTSSESRTNPFLTDSGLPPVTNRSARATPSADGRNFYTGERLVKKGSSRQSASLQSINSGLYIPDDPSGGTAEDGSLDGQRRSSLGVVLPSAVAVRRKPIVSVPNDDIEASDSPPRSTAPGRHWLDEPEDLGVEPSPPDSPVAKNRSAYQRAMPAILTPDLPRTNLSTRTSEPPQNPFLTKEAAAEPAYPPQRNSPKKGVAKMPVVASVEIPQTFDQLDSPFDRPRSPTKRVLKPEAISAARGVEEPKNVPQTNPFLPPTNLEASPTISDTISKASTQPRPLSQPIRTDSPTKSSTRVSSLAPAVVVQPGNQINRQPIVQSQPPTRTPEASVPFVQASTQRDQPLSYDDRETKPANDLFLARDDAQTGARPASVNFAPKSKVINLEDESPPARMQNLEAQNGGIPSTSGRQEEEDSQATVLMQELRAVAALEASIYLARGLKHRRHTLSSKKRMLHSPARRLARTIISLGQDEGTIFGLRALRAIDAAAESATDIPGQAYWWSNCIQLRWMLWAVCHGGDVNDPELEPEIDSDEFDWVMQVLVPPLRELEAEIFQQLFQYMWSCVLMEGITADQLPGYSQKRWSMQPNPQEESVERWIDALQTAHRALLPAANAVSAGHVNMLKHKILTALMRRLDSSLFDILLEGDSRNSNMPMSVRMIEKTWEGRKASGLGRELKLGPELLPFDRRGPLSFTLGVTLKMAATAWTTWASDIGLRNDSGSPEEGSMLFPKLRATADLLMMKKELLTDRAIRNEMIPGLKLRQICELLQRFRPDENDPQDLPPGLLEALYNETPPAEQPESPTAEGRAGYEPPSEAALLASGLIDPVSLEFNDESEDELEALSEMFDPEQQGHTSERFQLLRELWASAR